MLKEHSTLVKHLIALLDCAVLVATFYLSHRFVGTTVTLRPIVDYWVMFFGFLFFYLYFAWTRSLFSIQQFNMMATLSRPTTAIFISAAVLGAAILYLTPDQHSSRRLYLVFVASSFVVIGLQKILLRRAIAWLRRHNRNTTPVLLFGRGRMVTRLGKEIEAHPEWGLRVRDKLDMRTSPEEFERVLRNAHVEEVMFCVPRSASVAGFSVDPYIHTCEEMGRPARVFLNVPEATHFARWEYHPFMGRSTLLSHTVELDPDQILFKRIFDVCISLAGLSLLAVLYAPVALAIRLTSSGPVFTRSVRVGKNGKKFVMYTFRTSRMVPGRPGSGAESHRTLREAESTPVGGLMRWFGLDDLPKFINVLAGDMAVVGIRPPVPEEVEEYKKWHYRRISAKPGMTGLWVVNGRNRELTADGIVRLDLSYIDSWSLWLDMKIIFQTMVTLFGRKASHR